METHVVLFSPDFAYSLFYGMFHLAALWHARLKCTNYRVKVGKKRVILKISNFLWTYYIWSRTTFYVYTCAILIDMLLKFHYILGPSSVYANLCMCACVIVICHFCHETRTRVRVKERWTATQRSTKSIERILNLTTSACHLLDHRTVKLSIHYFTIILIEFLQNFWIWNHQHHQSCWGSSLTTPFMVFHEMYLSILTDLCYAWIPA